MHTHTKNRIVVLVYAVVLTCLGFMLGAIVANL